MGENKTKQNSDALEHLQILSNNEKKNKYNIGNTQILAKRWKRRCRNNMTQKINKI